MYWTKWAKKNMHPDENAWQNIETKILLWAKEEEPIIQIATNVMWTIEEKAIQALKSDCIIIIIKEIIIKIIKGVAKPFSKLIKLVIFHKPKPPVFNKIEAKNTEANAGASTWARVNQLWNKKIGNLTKKGKRKKIVTNQEINFKSLNLSIFLLDNWIE